MEDPTLQATTSGASAAEDFYGQYTPSELSGVSGHALIFSYAPPDMVRQAKLEALQSKVRRKMLERKASLLDTHALTSLSVAAAAAATAAAAAAVRVSARANAEAVGSRDLVKSLVIPPEITEHGDEVRGSSEFIQDGERLEYQRPGRIAPDAAQGARPMPYYRTYEALAKRPSGAATGQRKKPWGVAAEAAGAGAGHRNGGGGGGAGGGGAGQGKAWGKELRAQLSDGMMTYVPSKFERPKNVGRTAFVPQGQAMEEARSKYESVKQRRPASAPQRRGAGGAAGAAAAGKGADADEGGRDSAGAGKGGALVSNGSAASAATGATGALRGTSSYRDRKLSEIPVVPVEETDLYAMYRQKSQQAGQALSPTKGRGSNSTIATTTSGGSSGARPPSAAQQRAQGGAGGGGGGSSRQTAAAGGTVSGANSRKGITVTAGRGAAPAAAAPTATAAAAGAGASGQVDAVARVRQRPASAAPAAAAPKAAWAPRNTNAASPSKAAAMMVPATAAEAAALASGSTRRPWSSRPNSSKQLASSVWDAPRPPSPSKTPVSSRPPSQRRITLPTAPAAAAAGSGGGTGADAASTGGTGATPRVGLKPMDPETRRQRQNRPGSAINTAKTNRLRAPTGSANGAPYGATTVAIVGEYSGGGPAWTSASATPRSPCDRTLLQERILGGLVRQYTFDEDEEDEGGAAAAADGGTGVVMPPRRPVRPHRATADAVASAAVGVGSGGLLASYGEQSQRQAYQRQQSQPGHASAGAVGRPQSAPNRRLRPPSPGHWAGRPEPEAVLSRAAALQHTTTGIVYDPELHPSPLDTYVNQLNGLD